MGGWGSFWKLGKEFRGGGRASGKGGVENRVGVSFVDVLLILVKTGLGVEVR